MENTNKSTEKIIYIILIQTVLVLLAARTLNYYHNQLTISDVLITIVAVLNFGVCIFVIRYLLNAESLHKQLSVQKNHLNAMDNSFKQIRSERHEFINHLQSIYGLMLYGKNEDAINYLNDVASVCRFNSNLISISNNSLKVLLLNKKNKADSKNIELKLSIESRLKSLDVKPTDITTIFGNLLDNAIDAVGNNENHKRKIFFNIIETTSSYHFSVQDTGPPMGDEVKEIFKQGFSTKGFNRGYGLYLVKSTIEKYEGYLHYENDTKTFSVTLPKREDIL
ncbi:MAG: GHKL domain-containing protein [Firmicutes bacterium]|nr:GHKL domain-containing protein [Bacillota bacterium]